MNPGNPETDQFVCGTCEAHARYTKRAFLRLVLGAAAGAAAGIVTSIIGHDSSAEAQIIKEFTEKGIHPNDHFSSQELYAIQRSMRLPTLRPTSYLPAQPKEIVRYGSLRKSAEGEPVGHADFTYTLVIPKGQRGSEPIEWVDSFRTLHELTEEKSWLEYQGQFTRSNPRIGNVIDLDVDITTIPNIGVFWTLVEQTGKLPAPTPGKKTIHTMAISLHPDTQIKLAEMKSPLATLEWGVGSRFIGYASMNAHLLTSDALRRSIMSVLVNKHETRGHAWVSAVHTNLDTRLNPTRDPNFGEVPGNIWAGGLRIVDGFRTIDAWHIMPAQLAEINVGPNSIITGSGQNNNKYETFLPNIQRGGRRAFLQRFLSMAA